MILRYTAHMRGGEAVEYRGDFHIGNIGVVLVSDNSDETLIPWHRVVDIVRYRTDDNPFTLRETLRRL